MCKASGSHNFKSHEISECWLLNDQDRSNITKATARAYAMFATDEQTEAASEILFKPRVQSSEAGADHT